MRAILLSLLLICPNWWSVVCFQGGVKPGPGRAATGGGGSSPAYVSACTSFTGSGSVNCSVTAGNHLIVYTLANDRTTGHSCSDGSNTYVHDLTDSLGLTGDALIQNLFHVKTLASTTTITVSCTGTTPIVAAIQYSGGTGDLDAAASGTNPSANAGNSIPVTVTALTPTTAATILVDFYGDLSGGTITLSQTDTNFTTRGSCLTGASCFVGATGTRVVASAASYSDGFTPSGTSGWTAVLAAYK